MRGEDLFFYYNKLLKKKRKVTYFLRFALFFPFFKLNQKQVLTPHLLTFDFIYIYKIFIIL